MDLCRVRGSPQSAAPPGSDQSQALGCCAATQLGLVHCDYCAALRCTSYSNFATKAINLSQTLPSIPSIPSILCS